MKRILILGNGMAAGKLSQELVRFDCRDEIVIAGEEGPGIYNRIMLMHYLMQGMPGGDSATQFSPEDFWIVPEPWFGENKIKVFPGYKAVAIDRAARTVRFENGNTESYDTLILALGSRPFRPPVRGLEAEGVYALRSIKDADKIRVELALPRRILVIGGGLLGLEMALELKGLGHAVTVAHASPGLMERHLDLTGGKLLQKHLEASGLGILTDEICTELQTEGNRVARAIFKSGKVVETDLVFLSAGIVPETQIAKDCGLDVGRGIKVDDRLRTSDPSIYAVGECLEWQGKMWGLINTSFEQARNLAQILVGKDVAYKPSDHPPTRLKAPVFAASLGSLASEAGDEVFEFKDPSKGVYKKVIVREGRIVGAQAVGSISEEDPLRWDAVELAFSSAQVLTESPGQILFSIGKAEAADPKTWPDSLRICNCNGVSAGEIREAIAKGTTTFEGVMKATRAGTGCSTCRVRLRALVEAEAGVSSQKAGKWKRFVRFYQEHEIKGFTPYWIVSYCLDFLMAIAFLTVAATGILKFPGFLALIGISIRRMPMGLLMLLHDWGGLTLASTVFLHIVIHFGMMIAFLRSMFKKKKE